MQGRFGIRQIIGNRLSTYERTIGTLRNKANPFVGSTCTTPINTTVPNTDTLCTIGVSELAPIGGSLHVAGDIQWTSGGVGACPRDGLNVKDIRGNPPHTHETIVGNRQLGVGHGGVGHCRVVGEVSIGSQDAPQTEMEIRRTPPGPTGLGDDGRLVRIVAGCVGHIGCREVQCAATVFTAGHDSHRGIPRPIDGEIRLTSGVHEGTHDNVAIRPDFRLDHIAGRKRQ